VLRQCGRALIPATIRTSRHARLRGYRPREIPGRSPGAIVDTTERFYGCTTDQIAHDLAEQEARALHQRRTQLEIGAAADTLELTQRTEEEA